MTPFADESRQRVFLAENDSQKSGVVRKCLQITDTSLKLFSLYFRAFL
jgi:hypothetical protein